MFTLGPGETVASLPANRIFAPIYMSAEGNAIQSLN
jgi:hypothetical protein